MGILSGIKNWKIFKYRHYYWDWKKASQLYDDKDFEHAALLFEKAFQNDKENFELYEGLMASLINCKNYSKAETIFKEYSDHFIKGAAHYRILGWILIGRDKTNEALEALNESLVMDPDEFGTLAARAELLHKSGRDKEALKDYQRMIDLGTDPALAYNNRGYYYTTVGRYEEALADLDRALAVDPRHAFALDNRGLALVQLGRTLEGYRDILRSIELLDTNSYAYRNLGIYYMSNGDYSKALIELRKARDLDATTPDVNELITEAESKLK